MRIKTGKGTIPVVTLLSIWSISAITALPGLAVTPILGDLHTIFPRVSNLDVQMISSFPNLFIIPFVLLSGKMSESKNKIRILVLGLCIFLISGVLYLFAKSIIALILISCLLGVGAGMVTPLSTGLVADFFIGKYRTKQMGLSSGINNLTLVIATIVAGWLATKNWHLPFIVYLIPIFALILSHFLTQGYLFKQNVKFVADDACENQEDLAVAAAYVPANKSLNTKLLIGLMVVYFLITYIIILVSYNLSFILEKRNVNSVESGWMISILFLAITIPGFCITPIVRFFKNSVVYLSFLAIVIGFLMILILKNTFFIAVGVFLIGGAYGIVQPLIYDKTSLSAKPQKAVFALACVMSANYLAIYLCPYIASGFQAIFHQKQDMAFPFWVNMIMASILVIISFIGHKSIIFSAESSMFHEKSESGGSKAAQAVEPTEPTEPTVNPAKSIQVDAANKTAQSTARPENTQTSEEAQIKKTEAQKSDTVNSDLKSSPKTDSDVDRAENKTEDIKAIEQSKNDKIIEIKAPEQNADDKTSDDEATKRSENDQSKTDSKDNVKE